MGRVTRTNFGLTKKVAIDNASILTMQTTLVPIVLPDAGETLALIAIVLQLPATSAAYGNFAPLSWIEAEYSADGVIFGSASCAVLSSNLLAGGGGLAVLPSFTFPDAANFLNIFNAFAPGADYGIYLKAFNGGADYNGGDPLNVMTVTAFYNSIPTV